MGACAQIAVFTFAYAANALLCLYSAAVWAQVTGASFSVPLNQDLGHYTQDLMITPRITNKTVICEQAPNHGFYFAYAQLYFRKLSI